ncbi:MAG: DUF4259 domain-containing protein [Planctomycetota bacterium]|jgi:hypothetical protein
MGTWGHGTFHNDDAADWLYELDEGGLDVVDAALQAATLCGFLAAPEGCTALAAAEVVAAMRGRPAADLPEALLAWLRQRRAPPSAGLVARAQKAVAAVLADSELADLWRESGQFEAWQVVVRDLAARLH